MDWLTILLAAVMITLSAVAWAGIFMRGRAGLHVVPLAPRRPVPWSGVDLLMVAVFYVLAHQAFWWIFSFMAFSASAAPSVRGAAEDSMLSEKLATSTAANLLTIGFALLWIRSQTDVSWQDFGWRGEKVFGDLRLGLIAFAALAAPIYGLQAVLSSDFVKEHFSELVKEQHPIIEELRRQPSPLLYALAGLSAVLVAPLAEEFLFRVLLQGWLESVRLPTNEPATSGEHRPRPSAIVVTSILFASMHIGHGAAPVPLFFLALALGYLYQRTHRLLPSVTVHFCLNACSFAALCLAPLKVAL